MPRRSESIKKFLELYTHADLASLYTRDMEVQVLVAEDGGMRVDKEYHGKSWQSYTDGVQTWNTFRMPRNAMANPEDNDTEMLYDLSEHALGIGMTGWDWANKVSRWVGFDFDAIIGHSEKHAKKLDDNELSAVREAVSNIDFVTLRKSTSGKGLHLYIFLDLPVRTENHTQHSALARAILSQMSSICSFDFESKVDSTGLILWQWHRKMKGTDGLTLVKRGVPLRDVPPHWEDHIAVTSGKQKKITPFFIKTAQNPDEMEALFNELSGQSKRIPLDEDHNRLLTWLRENGNGSWWDSDHWMLVTHTFLLKQAHSALQMKGVFETVATGSEKGDHNAFAYPMRNGAWSVRRYSPGCAEHKSWAQDGHGWTRTYLNLIPDLRTAARAFGGDEKVSGGYVFRELEVAQKVLEMMGVPPFEMPGWSRARKTILKKHKDGRLIIEFQKEDLDRADDVQGWLPEGKFWKKVFDIKIGNKEPSETPNFDKVVRHLVTEGNENYGWTVKSAEGWSQEPLEHVKAVLEGAFGYKGPEIKGIIGTAVMAPWVIVNRPFEPEYPKDRYWNRNAVQLRFVPSQDIDSLKFECWSKILNHLGKGLDEAISESSWCKLHNVKSGGDYLKIWLASLFQKPTEPLPYLFFYSEKEQNVGKSTFHEAVSLLVTHGVVRADQALMPNSSFNAELENAILCVVEETNLNKGRTGSTTAYNRIKDWVTAKRLSIHRKTKTPYTVPNCTHWVQCANERDACPIFPGDSRIVVIRVDKIDPIEMIPRIQFHPMLEKEAPDFLAELLRVDVPPSYDRLSVPVIETREKTKAAEDNMSLLELFIRQCCYPVSGKSIDWMTFYNRFIDQLEPQYIEVWTKKMVTKHLPDEFPKGRVSGGNWVVANISFEPYNPEEPVLPRLVPSPTSPGYLIPKRDNGNGKYNEPDTSVTSTT